VTTATWKAPGPGLWQRDDVHAPHAMTRYFATVFNPVFDAGMREALRSYGLPLDHFDIRMVGQRQYTRPRPIGAPEKPGASPPRFVFTLLFLLHPELRYRKKRAAEVFAKKLWRQDHLWWHNELAPKLQRTNLALQQVDPATLDDATLRAHIAATTKAFVEGGTLHFRLSPGCMIPIGDWLRRTCEWAGCSPAEAMTVLKGKSQMSIAPLALLDRLAEAALRVPVALEVFRTPQLDPQRGIDDLRASDRAVAQALDAYLDEYGLHLVTGFDICDLTLRELPHVLLRSIEAQIERKTSYTSASLDQEMPQGEADRPNNANIIGQAATALRERVPATVRAEYDSLLEEACFSYGFEDEHVGIAYLWPAGLIRRALLVAGERLVSRNVIQHPEHLLDATPDEVSALLGGPGIAPSGEDLANRADTRQRLNLEEMPLQLGEVETPPPADLLPPACARVTQAMMFFMAHSNFATTSQSEGTKAGTLMEEVDISSSGETGKHMPLHGQGVSYGRYEGRACVVRGPADFGKIEAGDVLVTRTTSPAYNVLLPLLGAVVTDRGGVLCHAAIVAREFGIPAVVGTGDATSRIADGTRIVVDGERGTVEILE
jgi:rifampicin phosphotransferase